MGAMPDGSHVMKAFRMPPGIRGDEEDIEGGNEGDIEGDHEGASRGKTT